MTFERLCSFRRHLFQGTSNIRKARYLKATLNGFCHGKNSRSMVSRRGSHDSAEQKLPPPGTSTTVPGITTPLPRLYSAFLAPRTFQAERRRTEKKNENTCTCSATSRNAMFIIEYGYPCQTSWPSEEPVEMNRYTSGR